MKKLALLTLALILLICPLSATAEDETMDVIEPTSAIQAADGTLELTAAQTGSDTETIVVAKPEDTQETEAGEPAAGPADSMLTNQGTDAEDTADKDEAVKWTFTVSVTELESDHAILVNRDHLLASDYVPATLTRAQVKCVSSSRVEICKETEEALEKMFEGAAAVTEYTYLVQDKKGNWVEKEFKNDGGLRLILKSGYRSYGTQKTVYKNYLSRNNGVDDGISSPPGASEHQSGLAVDVLSVDYNNNNQYMNETFYQTPEAQWMAENCYSYGFILRYPEDKEDITQVPYEPWHLRYVGREIAGYIRTSGLSLEEFTEAWQAELQRFVAAGGNIEAQMLLEATQKASGIESTVLEEYGEDGDAEISLVF